MSWEIVDYRGYRLVVWQSGAYFTGYAHRAADRLDPHHYHQAAEPRRPA